MYDKFKPALATLILTLILTTTNALTINLISPTQNANYTTTVLPLNFTLDSSTNTTCVLQLNNVNTTQNECTNTTLALSQGQNTLTIYATDLDSNYTFLQTIFYVDSNAPTMSAVIQNAKSTYVLLNVSSNEPSNTTMTYWTNPSNTTSVQNATYTIETQFNLTNLNQNTTYYYNLTGCDELANCNTTTSSFTTNALPVVNFNTPALNSTASSILTLNATATDETNITQLTFTISNQTWNTTLNTTNNASYWTTQLNTTALTDGQYNLSATTTDSANEQTTSTTSFKIDNTKPTLQLYNYTNNTKIKTTTITLNYSATDYTLDKCWYVLDLQTINLPNCQNTNIVALTESTHLLTIYVNDSTNQTNKAQLNFTIDATQPVISNFDFDRVNTNVNLTWNTNEPTNYTIRFGPNQTYESTRTNNTLTTSFNIQLTDMEYAKTYGFNLTACDEANNCANATLTMAMPNAAPTQTQTTSAASGGAGAAAPAEPAALRAATSAPIITPLLENTSTTENNSAATNTTNQTTNQTQLPAHITAFATAQDQNNFAIGLALLSGLSILMYGYKQPLLQRVKSKNKKVTKKHVHKEEHKEKNRYAYLEQVNGKKVHFPIEHKPHKSTRTKN